MSEDHQDPGAGREDAGKEQESLPATGETAGTESSEGAAAMAGSSMADAMAQIRELLFGEAQRINDRQFEQLGRRIEEIGASASARLEEIEKRLDALDRRTREEQSALIVSIGTAIESVGRQIVQLDDDGETDDAAPE